MRLLSNAFAYPANSQENEIYNPFVEASSAFEGEEDERQESRRHINNPKERQAQTHQNGSGELSTAAASLFFAGDVSTKASEDESEAGEEEEEEVS